MRQDNFYDIKSLITRQNSLNNAKGFYFKHVYFKYDYDDYIEMNIRSTTTKNTRKRKFASTAAASSIADDVTLQPAYNGPFPILKLYTTTYQDLVGLTPYLSIITVSTIR